jgi:alpha-galactosidase
LSHPPADRRSFLKAASLLSLAGATAALPAGEPGADPIDGTWEVTIGKLADGRDLNAYFVLKRAGKKLTGRGVHYGMEFDIYRATIDGDRFRFEDLALVEGRVAGDQLIFTANYEDDAPYSQVLDNSVMQVPSVPTGRRREFTARRVPASAALPPARIELPTVRDLPGNGLAPTPPMVWGAWYSLTIAITDPLIREMADALVSSGLRDAGYNVLNMEVGWTGVRDARGRLTANPKFPDIKGLADYVHARGLKLGICTSPGPYDCTGYLGSHGHEEQDARTFAEWGIDYIKHDMCSANATYKPADERQLYQKMGSALQASGRPIVYSLCQYGVGEIWKWGAQAGGNLWRVSSDIFDTWESVRYIGFETGDLSSYAGPGRWNDYDYLMVGLGHLTDDEYRTQMTQWCMVASPLITSIDPRRLSPLEKEILLNRELIAVNQDRKGLAGRCVHRRGKTQVWTRPLGDGHAVALYNLGESPATVTADLKKLGLPVASQARDLWTHSDVGIPDGKLSKRLPPHGSAIYRVV